MIKTQNGKVQRVQMKLKINIVTNMPQLISIPRQRFPGLHNCCGWATPTPWSSKICASYQRKRKQNTSLRSSVISMQVNRYADIYKIYLLRIQWTWFVSFSYSQCFQTITSCDNIEKHKFSALTLTVAKK